MARGRHPRGDLVGDLKALLSLALPVALAAAHAHACDRNEEEGRQSPTIIKKVRGGGWVMRTHHGPTTHHAARTAHVDVTHVEVVPSPTPIAAGGL